MAGAENVAVVAPLVSIVIPCCGMLEYTRLCIPSVLRHSRPPYELIFVDIGSLDGTAEYIAGLRDGLQGRVRVEVAMAATDLDIGAACKDAIKKARGDYICLLNNDTVVTPAWLDMMITLAQMSEANGLVGPMSNCAAGPQLVETVPYRIGPKKAHDPGEPLVDVQAVEAFAQQRRKEKPGKWITVDRLGGFCLLVRRAVLENIGPALHQWTDLSLFDSDILSSKAHQAGFTLVRCSDVFIHHFGTRAFAHGAPRARHKQRKPRWRRRGKEKMYR